MMEEYGVMGKDASFDEAYSVIGETCMRVGQTVPEVKSVLVQYRSDKFQRIVLGTVTKRWDSMITWLDGDVFNDGDGYPRLIAKPVHLVSGEVLPEMVLHLPDLRGWTVDAAYPAKYGIVVYLRRGSFEPVAFEIT